MAQSSAPTRTAPPGPAPRRSLAVRMVPFAALGLLALIPIRAISLAVHWQELFTSPAATTSGLGTGLPRPLADAEGAAPLDHTPAETGAVVALRDGVIARPMVSATLSGAGRASPVGEQRPANGQMLAEIARRNAELDKRQHELDTRSSQVEAAETLAKQQIAELTRLRAEIEGLVVHETTAADADLDMLVGLYQNMKPAQAAAVLGKLEPGRAGMILQKLGDRTGGPILAAMDPNAALAITEDIAQRRSAFRH